MRIGSGVGIRGVHTYEVCRSKGQSGDRPCPSTMNTPAIASRKEQPDAVLRNLKSSSAAGLWRLQAIVPVIFATLEYLVAGYDRRGRRALQVSQGQLRKVDIEQFSVFVADTCISMTSFPLASTRLVIWKCTTSGFQQCAYCAINPDPEILGARACHRRQIF